MNPPPYGQPSAFAFVDRRGVSVVYRKCRR
jgi:hypothetical protein